MVKTRNLKSNLRQITEWTTPLDYRYIVNEARGQVVSGSGPIRLRADVGDTREAAGDVPVPPLRYTTAARGSVLPLTASGSFPAGPCSLDWSGSASYEALPPPGSKRRLIAYMKADGVAHVAMLGLALAADQPDFVQSGCTQSRFQAGFGTLHEQVSYPTLIENNNDQIPLHSLRLAFNDHLGFADHFSIGAGSFESVLVRLKWQEVVPRFAPLPSDGS
jgi:hypothetical protein